MLQIFLSGKTEVFWAALHTHSYMLAHTSTFVCEPLLAPACSFSPLLGLFLPKAEPRNMERLADMPLW